MNKNLHRDLLNTVLFGVLVVLVFGCGGNTVSDSTNNSFTGSFDGNIAGIDQDKGDMTLDNFSIDPNGTVTGSATYQGQNAHLSGLIQPDGQLSLRSDFNGPHDLDFYGRVHWESVGSRGGPRHFVTGQLGMGTSIGIGTRGSEKIVTITFWRQGE